MTTGIATQRALVAAESLSQDNIDCGVFHMHTIKPFDNSGLFKMSESAKLIITIEEHVLNGGLGSAVLEAFSDNGLDKTVVRLGIPDIFSKKYGSQDILMDNFGLSADNIAKTVMKYLNFKRST